MPTPGRSLKAAGAARRLPSQAMPSRNQATTAPMPIAQKSMRAWSTASLPLAWRLLRVVAAAVPEGKRSCSTLIICRFMGMASMTPSMARKNVQPMRVQNSMWVWVTRR
ncbi:hypothetical protein D3C87_1094290 [compost metagenome]